MKNNKIIKRLVLVLTTTISVIFTPVSTFVHAEEMNSPVKSVQPREMLTGSYTTDVTADSGSKVITIKIYYTYRYESSNSSGRYITGIQRGTILSCSGWKSASGLSVSTNSVVYSNNHQRASFSISYYGGMGTGNTSYMTSTVNIFLA